EDTSAAAVPESAVCTASAVKSSVPRNRISQRAILFEASTIGTNVGSGDHRRLVPLPVTRAGTAAAGAIPRIRVPAAVGRETAAADAAGQAVLEPLELRDPLLYPGPPSAREAGPVAPDGGPVVRELRQLAADLLEIQPDPLGEDDERHAPQD